MRLVRPASVAGRFYPADPMDLAETVKRMLAETKAEPGDDDAAYVVPHAGYRYSGPVAATVYARLAARAEPVRRVVLIGPAHFVPIHGCAVPSAEAFATPLGEVPVDTRWRARLVRRGLAMVNDTAHEPEHSLEVQLPFLQVVLGAEWTVLPIVVGPSTLDRIGRLLWKVTEEPALVVCTTDLSHYLPEGAARERDQHTAQAVLGMAPERIGMGDVCGWHALAGLLTWAHLREVTPELLDLRTSADTIGNPDRVVGYGAFAFS